eukprot:gene11530-24121_t
MNFKDKNDNDVYCGDCNSSQSDLGVSNKDKTTLDNEEAEWQHWNDVMRTFLLYEDFSALGIRRRQDHLNRLSKEDMDRLPPSTFSKIDDVIHGSRQNQFFFQNLVEFQDFGFAPRDHTQPLPLKYEGNRIHVSQMHKNHAVLHSLVREWSKEGQSERDACFQPLIDELQLRLPVSPTNAYKQRVVVPGCGLSRLAVEIVSRGYSCQANEFSMFMLTASHFILNGIRREGDFEIFPWIDKVCNIMACKDATSGIRIPDVTAGSLLNSGPYSHLQAQHERDRHAAGGSEYPVFSMAAGDFVALYGADDNKDSWDCVVTCFFLDTAPVVI